MAIMLLAFIATFSLILNCKADTALPFKDQCVKWHNEFRAKHQVGPVAWNNDIANGAAQWAKHLADNNLFQHARNIKEGENLYMSTHKPTEPCTTATKAFYAEVKYYDFDKPGFSPNTGHFTQVVWKNTKQIGAAQATRKDGRSVVVIRYSPPGNYIGEKPFRANVLPIKEGGVTTPSATPPVPHGGGPGQMCCFLGFKAFVIIAVTTIMFCA